MKIELFFFRGEGGVRFRFLPRIFLIWGIFQEVRDQEKVWGLDDSFDKDILVSGCGTLSGLHK